MVKLVNPLQSEAASGKVGEGAIYGRRRGQNIARRYARPRQPNTTGQKASTERMMLTGILSQRIREGNIQIATTQTSIIQFFDERADRDQTWQQAFTKAMYEFQPSIYDWAQTLWVRFDPRRKASWNNGAKAPTARFPDKFLNGQEFTAGELSFALQLVMQRIGYIPTVDYAPHRYLRAA